MLRIYKYRENNLTCIYVAVQHYTEDETQVDHIYLFGRRMKLSLPKAEHAITLSTFVPQDIRDRRLLSLRGRLSVGRLCHKCRSRHITFIGQTKQSSPDA